MADMEPAGQGAFAYHCPPSQRPEQEAADTPADFRVCCGDDD